MRKSSILLIFIILVFRLDGQVINNINLFSGISFSKITWNTNGLTLYERPIIGYSTGLKIGYLEHNYWTCNTKIRFYQLGGSDKVTLVDANGNNIEDITTRFYFNELGINATIQVKYPINKFIPFIYLGPRLDFLLSSSQSFKDIEKNNYGLDFGIGLSYHLTDKVFLTSDIGYSLLIRKIVNKTNCTLNPDINMLIEVGIGCNFLK